MAVKIVSKAGADVKEVLAKYNKIHGAAFAGFGGLPVQAQRIPTGLFPFDLATGGGFPKGRCSIVYGPADSGKTSIIFAAIAHYQKLWPNETCTYIAVEPFDKEWAQKMHVDTDKLVVVNPAYAEQVVD